MRVNRISLDERLRRLKKGCRADDAYNEEAIVRFANINIIEYMKAYPAECRAMMHSLDIHVKDAIHMTYQDVAKVVYEMYNTEEHKQKAIEAMWTLAKPFDHCYEERNQYYE